MVISFNPFPLDGPEEKQSEEDDKKALLSSKERKEAQHQPVDLKERDENLCEFFARYLGIEKFLSIIKNSSYSTDPEKSIISWANLDIHQKADGIRGALLADPKKMPEELKRTVRELKKTEEIVILDADLTALPEEMAKLFNSLKILCLENCKFLEDISVIRDLKFLEYLYITGKISPKLSLDVVSHMHNLKIVIGKKEKNRLPNDFIKCRI